MSLLTTYLEAVSAEEKAILKSIYSALKTDRDYSEYAKKDIKLVSPISNLTNTTKSGWVISVDGNKHKFLYNVKDGKFVDIELR